MDMLCCLGGGSNPGAAYAAQTSDGFGSYPGNRPRPQRPYAATGGNALAAAPPANTGNPDMVYVTVPPGVYPGQTINVGAPDGSGRMVTTVVPQGSAPGSQFMVQFPPVHVPMATAELYNNNNNINGSNNYNGASSYNATANPVATNDFCNALDQPYTPTSSMVPMPAPYTQQQPQQQQPMGAPAGQKLLLVRVPPGTPPGTTLNVQIPDEPGRLVAAQVPPNVTEFHVAYQPMANRPSIPANPYNNYNSSAAAPRPNGYNNNNNYNNGYNNGYNNRFGNNNNNNGGNQGGGGGMGGFLVPALGGAALGAAAVGIYDHFSDNDGGGGGGDYADTGGYDGGDDYGGGGDDFGGGDW